MNKEKMSTLLIALASGLAGFALAGMLSDDDEPEKKKPSIDDEIAKMKKRLNDLQENL